MPYLSASGVMIYEEALYQVSFYLGGGVQSTGCVLILSVVICSTSVKYSRTSVCKGTRLMALCDVALGRCHDTCQHDTTLTRPPDDFDSLHGVKGSDDVTSDFKVGY